MGCIDDAKPSTLTAFSCVAARAIATITRQQAGLQAVMHTAGIPHGIDCAKITHTRGAQSIAAVIIHRLVQDTLPSNQTPAGVAGHAGKQFCPGTSGVH